MKYLSTLTAAITPKKILATAFTVGALTAVAAPAVATVTATAAPASAAMSFDGPSSPHMVYD